MTTRSSAASLAVLMVPLSLLVSQSQLSAGLFCPTTRFCTPAPPCIKYKCICPMPINPCCGLENFGYYRACWQPWPFPPDYSHCPVPPPAVTTEPAPQGATTPSQEELPSPTKEEPEAPSKDQPPMKDKPPAKDKPAAKDQPPMKDQPPVKDQPEVNLPKPSQGNDSAGSTHWPLLR